MYIVKWLHCQSNLHTHPLWYLNSFCVLWKLQMYTFSNVSAPYTILKYINFCTYDLLLNCTSSLYSFGVSLRQIHALQMWLPLYLWPSHLAACFPCCAEACQCDVLSLGFSCFSACAFRVTVIVIAQSFPLRIFIVIDYILSVPFIYY